MILYKMEKNGGFTVYDASTGLAAYAYPDSLHARHAKSRPEKIARTMARAERNINVYRYANADMIRRNREWFLYLLEDRDTRRLSG